MSQPYFVLDFQFQQIGFHHRLTGQVLFRLEFRLWTEDLILNNFNQLTVRWLEPGTGFNCEDYMTILYCKTSGDNRES